MSDPSRPEIACLLPARNAVADLPSYLESATRFADAVVALDDGSTDGTRDLLADDPLVRVLLTNPVRSTYAGWDDGANRNSLLAAAAELEPSWIVWLDADERLDESDAQALRAFVRTDAVRGLAFGFRHFRMFGQDRFDPTFTYVYRLFAFEQGQRVPARRLHFNPVPETIPRALWVRTTIRIQHFASSTEARRRSRLEKYREADPEEEYETNFGRLSEPRPHRVLPLWQPRPARLAILAPPDEEVAEVFPEEEPEGSEERRADESDPRVTSEASLPSRRASSGRQKLVCLLPVRNGEADLPGYLASVSHFADAIVALDDGSTDGTAEMLESEPLVRRVLRHPSRPGYEGWDDAANRSRLLQVAAELEPEWILFLDVDERIDPDDAAALRAFLDTEAEAGFAYGFRIYRMSPAGDGYDRADLWAFRLFAFEPGLSLPPDRLHFVPVPTAIPRDRWIRTTIRIQHLGGSTPERRRSRFEKYAEADPDRFFQAGYEALLEHAVGFRPWTPRPPGLPVLLPPGTAPSSGADLHDLDLSAPVLSAIVIAQEDEATIERTVRSVVDQKCPEPFEVIVVTSGTDSTAGVVRRAFPDVRVVELPEPALPGAARNAGLSAARGEYASFPGSHVELLPGSLAARVRAHELGYPMVTGSVLNGTRTPAGWASYFLDHSTALPGRPSGPLSGPPVHCSYAREFLLRAGGFPEDLRAGEDTVANHRMWRMGYRAYRAQELVLIHHSPCRDLSRLLRHHFQRGRGFGRIVLDQRRGRGPVLTFGMLRRNLVGYLPRRLSLVSAQVRRWGGPLRDDYRRVRPWIFAGAAAAWVGTWYELLRPAPGKASALFPFPGIGLVIDGPWSPQTLVVARLDVLGARIRMLEVPGEVAGDALAAGGARASRAISAMVGLPVTDPVWIDAGGLLEWLDVDSPPGDAGSSSADALLRLGERVRSGRAKLVRRDPYSFDPSPGRFVLSSAPGLRALTLWCISRLRASHVELLRVTRRGEDTIEEGTAFRA